ncbi:10074_t:CDS:2 [Ambispora gerdemannii]|uniref:10074_t:CDS:1 n=1 Tax=Ambispora gerdemannii TaxID=144530 RepID=A0A9N9BXP1_9GLOM|nr:10074_t:CDS:2 [Ambispora gerdemannii]
MALLLPSNLKNALYTLSNKCVISKTININPLRYLILRNTHSRFSSTTTSSSIPLRPLPPPKPSRHFKKPHREQEPTKNNDYDYDTYTKNLNAKILSLPEVKSLLAHPEFVQTRGFSSLNEQTHYHPFTARTLMGPGKFAVSPIVFLNLQTRELVGFQHIGRDLSGHEGIAHGGLLATVADEMFARLVIPCFPEKNAATVYLNINYRAPCPSDAIIKCYVKIADLEGRKAFVEGRIETIEDDDNDNINNIVVVDANGLFVSIKKIETNRKFAT